MECRKQILPPPSSQTSDRAMTEAENRVILPTTVTPIHYQLELTPNFTLLTFDGLEIINVNVSGKTLPLPNSDYRYLR